MCGVAGWYRRANQGVDPAIVAAQCTTIIHRGPDDQGVLVDGDFGFGMRRLSVVDLAGGHQPMTTADGRYSIVFNGEVYNFAELRSELAAAGHVFRTRSDTEVVLEAFAEWRGEAWARFDGMFAVAIWDHRTRTLHLARDPLGIKPLYWTFQSGGLAFGSELKTLGPVPGLRFAPDPLAVDQYLALGAVLAPRSIYREVFKLEPGHCLTLGPTGEPRIERFWALKIAPRPDVSEDEWIEECRSRLLDAVRSHLVADVPVGGFLSGGVDSSAVVAAMTRLSSEPVSSFTIGFPVAAFDESSTAATIAAHLGSRHVVRQLESRSGAEMLEQLAPIFDEPFADSSAIPTWYVSQLAREQVTVVLSGDGGDEMFAGYRRHRSELALARLKRLPGVESMLGMAAELPFLRGAKSPRYQRLAKIARDSALPTTVERFFAKQCQLDDHRRRALYSREFAAALPEDESCSRWAAELFGTSVPKDPVEALLYADTSVWLPDDMLTKVDRASMAHSLEVRVPLLSRRMVEWAATVPLKYKIRGNTGKYLLRRAIADWLPSGILDLPKKGFSVPMSYWMKGDFGDFALKVWRESGVEDSGYFAPDALAGLIEEHRRGWADHGQTLYGLVMFAYWWRNRLN